MVAEGSMSGRSSNRPVKKAQPLAAGAADQQPNVAMGGASQTRGSDNFESDWSEA